MVKAVYISGTRCTTQEKKRLAKLLAGKNEDESKKDFKDVLDEEIKKLESSQPTKAE